MLVYDKLRCFPFLHAPATGIKSSPYEGPPSSSPRAKDHWLIYPSEAAHIAQTCEQPLHTRILSQRSGRGLFHPEFLSKSDTSGHARQFVATLPGRRQAQCQMHEIESGDPRSQSKTPNGPLNGPLILLQVNLRLDREGRTYLA